MAARPNKFLPLAVATVVVFCARCLREELPEDDLSVNMAWVQMAARTWYEQQRLALIMDLVVSLWKAHDASPTTICWSDPKAYGSHCKRWTNSAITRNTSSQAREMALGWSTTSSVVRSVI